MDDLGPQFCDLSCVYCGSPPSLVRATVHVQHLPGNHVDLDRDAWITDAIANDIPTEYGPVLRQLTETISKGHGSLPNGTVERITGTAPRSFRNFAQKNASAWKAAK